MGRKPRSKGATHRPFRDLDLKLREEEPTPSEHVAGVVPLTAKGRIGAERPAAQPRPPEPPGFETSVVDGRVRGWREGDAFPAELLRGRPEATLDLHGARADVAAERVATFVRSARRRWTRPVLIVTGRGRSGGVLRHEVPDWLAAPRCSAHVLAFTTAPEVRGGVGALLVLLAPKAPR